MWVVKVGGSLVGSPRLRAWLSLLSRSTRPLVIVPGGGPFADQVRSAQQEWKFDDPTAHRMAILAMEQFGHMLVGLQPGLYPASTRTEIIRLARSGGIPVWLPSKMAFASDDLPQSWSVTGDSLAAWLAKSLGARCLILVKSAEPRSGLVPVDELREQGVVDRMLNEMIAEAAFETWCIASARLDVMAKALVDGQGLPTRIVA